MVFVKLLQVRKVNSLNEVADFDCTSKTINICYLFNKFILRNLQQYDEHHCVYLARIGHHSENKPAET